MLVTVLELTIAVSFSIEHNGFHVAEHTAELPGQPFLGDADW